MAKAAAPRFVVSGRRVGLGESTPADPFGDQFCPLTPFTERLR